MAEESERRGFNPSQDISVILFFPIGSTVASPVTSAELCDPQMLARPTPSAEVSIRRVNRQFVFGEVGEHIFFGPVSQRAARSFGRDPMSHDAQFTDA